MSLLLVFCFLIVGLRLILGFVFYIRKYMDYEK